MPTLAKSARMGQPQSWWLPETHRKRVGQPAQAIRIRVCLQAYRNVRLKISVTAIRERELDERAKTAFGNAASRVQRGISGLGSSIGRPWTKDHKAAALAAAMILAREETAASPVPLRRVRS